MVVSRIDIHTKPPAWRVFIPEEMGQPADEHRRQLVARVYAESGPRLYRYALMILADHRDAEDVIQQVFAAVLTRPVRIDDEAAYFRTAVRNAAYSLLRQRRTARAAGDALLEPVSSECGPAEQAALEQALRALPPDQREVVHLHVYEGMTFNEIAGATGDSINTVAARYRYALDKMRKLLQ
jgi:RNA polymerase sigma-70 factor (ECF subfamily)